MMTISTLQEEFSLLDRLFMQEKYAANESKVII